MLSIVAAERQAMSSNENAGEAVNLQILYSRGTMLFMSLSRTISWLELPRSQV